MHALIRCNRFQDAVSVAVQHGDERIALVTIEKARASNVRRQGAVCDELGHDQLHKTGRLAVDEVALGDEGSEQRSWNNGISQSKTRKQRLVEGPDVEDAIGLVQTL